jgi:hypothetical protein
MKKKELTVFVLLFSAVVFLLFGVVLGWKNFQFTTDGVETQAIITRVDRKRYDTDGNEKAYVYVEYTVDGETYKGSFSTRYFNGMKQGDQVPVRYLSDNPDEFMYEEEISLLVPILCVVGGCACGIGGIVALLLKQKQD